MPEYYLGNRPEPAMKTVTIFYYGSDAAEAVLLAASERAAHNSAFTRDATVFDGQLEECTRVVVMPGVRPHHRAKLLAAYGTKVVDGEIVADRPAGSEQAGTDTGSAAVTGGESSPPATAPAPASLGAFATPPLGAYIPPEIITQPEAPQLSADGGFLPGHQSPPEPARRGRPARSGG